jgi:hypothetical protein
VSGQDARSATKPRGKSKRKPQRAKHLGITDDAYEQLLEAQEGGCAICGNPPKTRRLSVDHNHRTGKVRGLLCFRCNRALPTYATSEWLRGAYVYVLRDEYPDLDVPDQWLEPIDQWAEAR